MTRTERADTRSWRSASVIIMIELVKDALRNVAGFVLIAFGVVLSLICGMQFAIALIEWGTGIASSSSQRVPLLERWQPGLIALVPLCGLICGITLVRVARRVQIPARLLDLRKRHK